MCAMIVFTYVKMEDNDKHIIVNDTNSLRRLSVCCLFLPRNATTRRNRKIVQDTRVYVLKIVCKFQLWLPWLAGLPYQFSTMKQRTSFSVMEEWEGVLGRGDGVNDGDVPDAEWLPLMKSGACNLERIAAG